MSKQPLNLVRISKLKADSTPFARATYYKWRHLGKFPEIFIKVGGGLFLDLDALQHVMESGRTKEA